MLKLREDFNIKKLKFWGFEKVQDSWYKNIDENGCLNLKVNQYKEVTFCTSGKTVECDFIKEIFDLIKAEVLIWN